MVCVSRPGGVFSIAWLFCGTWCGMLVFMMAVDRKGTIEAG